MAKDATNRDPRNKQNTPIAWRWLPCKAELVLTRAQRGTFSTIYLFKKEISISMDILGGKSSCLYIATW
jgi:hypothetical protein